MIVGAFREGNSNLFFGLLSEPFPNNSKRSVTKTARGVDAKSATTGTMRSKRKPKSVKQKNKGSRSLNEEKDDDAEGAKPKQQRDNDS